MVLRHFEKLNRKGYRVARRTRRASLSKRAVAAVIVKAEKASTRDVTPGLDAFLEL